MSSSIPPFFFISYSGNRKKFFRNIFAPKNMKGSDSNGRSCLILNSSILRTTIFSWFSFSCHWFEITASIFDARINEEAPATLLNSKGDNLKAGEHYRQEIVHGVPSDIWII